MINFFKKNLIKNLRSLKAGKTRFLKSWLYILFVEGYDWRLDHPGESGKIFPTREEPTAQILRKDLKWALDHPDWFLWIKRAFFNFYWFFSLRRLSLQSNF